MFFLVKQYSVEHGDHNLDASLTAIFGCLSLTLGADILRGHPIGLNYQLIAIVNVFHSNLQPIFP